MEAILADLLRDTVELGRKFKNNKISSNLDDFYLKNQKNKKIVTGNITNEIQSYIKIINEELIQSSEMFKK